MRTIAIALFGALCWTASAQDHASSPEVASLTAVAATTPAGGDNCIMAPEETWKTLGLSPDQITKVKDLQARCSASKNDTEKDAASRAEHEKELASILTSEQYANWQKWCKEKGSAPGK